MYVFFLFWLGTVAGLVEGVSGLQEADRLTRQRGGVRERPQHLGDGIVQVI